MTDAPYLSAAQLRELDRAAEAGGVSIETLMENAGKAVAEEALKFLEAGKKSGNAKKPWKILILCGSGNNGGDGLAAAAFLQRMKAWPQIVFLKPVARLKGPVLTHFKKCRAAGIPFTEKMNGAIAPLNADLIIDAIFGTGFDGAVDSSIASAIHTVNAATIPVLSIDIPSGMNADTGKSAGSCIRAGLTVTLAAMKKGFSNPESKQWTGKIIVKDIGIPEQILNKHINLGG